MIGTAQIVLMFWDLHPSIPLFHYLLGSFGFGPLKAAFLFGNLTFASYIESTRPWDLTEDLLRGGFVLTHRVLVNNFLNDPDLSNQARSEELNYILLNHKSKHMIEIPFAFHYLPKVEC